MDLKKRKRDEGRGKFAKSRVNFPGPRNLQVSSQSSERGYVNLEVSWEAAECEIPNPVYRLLLSRNGAGPELKVSTQDSRVGVTRLEFWSNYEITLETSPKCSTEKLTANYSTGPGGNKIQ